jgi:Cu/Ag efflux protein CusF
MSKTWVVGAFALLFILAPLTPAWGATDTALGRIKNLNVDGNQFTLTHSDGKDYLYTLAENGKVHLSGGKDGKLGDLKTGDTVLVVFVRIDKGYYATEMYPHSDVIGEVMTGKYKKHSNKNQFWLTTGGKDLLFTLCDGAHVQAANKLSSLSELREGEDISVNAVKARGGLYAAYVTGK